MDNAGPVKRKSYGFALHVVQVIKEMRGVKRETVLMKRLIRAATSVGANVEEANAARSKRDFIAKMTIASKEARESNYWLRLLKDAGYFDDGIAERLSKECQELIKLLTTIVKTAQRNEKLKRI